MISGVRCDRRKARFPYFLPALIPCWGKGRGHSARDVLIKIIGAYPRDGPRCWLIDDISIIKGAPTDRGSRHAPAHWDTQNSNASHLIRRSAATFNRFL